MEIWKNIKGHPGYQVSNTGKVISFQSRGRGACKQKSLYGKELSQFLSTGGYLYVNIKGKQESVHSLVAKTFLTEKPGRHQVNHVDENKLNNNVENLEWCTQKENNNHGTRVQRIAVSSSCPVVGINIESGFILQFPSAKSAMSVIPMDARAFRKHLKDGKPFKGRIWLKVKERNRPVIQINENGEVVKKYHNLAEASKDTGVKYNSIWRACQSHTMRAGGIRWNYV